MMMLFVRRRFGSPRRLLVTSVWFMTAAVLMLFLAYGWKALFHRDVILIYNDMSFVVRLANAKGQACVPPVLKPWPDSLKKLYAQKPEPIRCAEAGPDWVYVENGTFRIYAQARKTHGRVTCAYTPLVRLSDDMTVVDGATVADMRDGWPITSDCFKASCRASDGSVRDHLIPAIAYEDRVHHRRPLPGKPDPAALRLNVIMLGFDSTSHMSWLRMLPRMHRYFTEALGGVVLDAYNIVGDATTQALLPMFTGFNDRELPEARRGHPGATQVDGYPWIWTKFQDAGYVTQFGEDSAPWATFQYRLLGFKEKPVDHFSRPFYIEVHKQRERHLPNCFGSVPRHISMFNWLRAFCDMYRRKPKFSFVLHSELSHHGMNDLQLADEDMEAFLRALNDSGHLDNTLLIAMSDHGARFNSARQSVQGKYEERMPYMGLRFPASFKRKYPEAARNLRTNVHRLTTPYDIHATFLDILKYDSSVRRGNIRQRGISLLKEIPRERRCVHAGVADHWCTCLSWKTVRTNNTNVTAAGNAIVRLMNELTTNQRNICRSLSLANVTSAVRYAASDQILRFRGSKDFDLREPDFSGTMSVANVLYQLTIVTTPGGGMFEATIKHDFERNKFSANVKDFSRINQYGQQSHCITEQFPNLRKFCYCVIQPTK